MAGKLLGMGVAASEECLTESSVRLAGKEVRLKDDVRRGDNESAATAGAWIGGEDVRLKEPVLRGATPAHFPCCSFLRSPSMFFPSQPLRPLR